MIAMSPIRNVCSKITSGGTPSRTKPEYFSADNSGHLWVKSKELKDSAIADTEERISDQGLAGSSAKYLPANTVLLAMYGANVGQLGWLRVPATVNQAICGLVINPETADFRYVFYALMETRAGLIAQAQGAAQQNLNQDKIKDFKIPLPPIVVQRRIAAILSAYDDLIENNTRRIAILEEMARRIYEEWFVRFRFPGHESVRMVESELGPVPEGWSFRPLGDVVDEVRDAVDPEVVPPETPYVGLEHIPRRSIALAEWGYAEQVQSTKLRFREQDILFGKIRPYFHKVAVAPVAGVCSSDAIVIRPRDEGDFGLALAVVSSDAFVAHATQSSNGTKMPRANWTVLRRYPVPAAPEAVHSRFEELMTSIVGAVRNHVMRNRNLRTTRDLLLPKLISGKLDVSSLPDAEAVAA